MTNTILDPDISHAFQCAGESHVLVGGEGRSVRVDQCVFKPIDNPDHYSWSCDLLLRLSREGFRLSEPRRASNGSFVFKGWGASSFEAGEHVPDRWQEKMEVLRLFHSKLRDLDYPAMPPSDDYWSLAHEIAWQVLPLPAALHSGIVNKIDTVFAHYQPLTRAVGIIHSDFGGNILFHDSLAPCVIDFSPAYGSVEYAEAIMIADATAWDDAPLEILNLLPFDEHYRQHLLRAINFRLIVAALFKPKSMEQFLNEYAAFKPMIDVVCKLGFNS